MSSMIHFLLHTPSPPPPPTRAYPQSFNKTWATTALANKWNKTLMAKNWTKSG